ncbi:MULTISPECIES: histidine phosphatase family protein [Bhargavaea]|uniref:Histidine phosphatase family protein n=1 Tax=Bhargavaea changchunensis TaxID=2134037 RepID=A0ABW2NIE5_9BACL|nr:histidine phosphatase family protein [Bhargavaea sp. CC-171006]
MDDSFVLYVIRHLETAANRERRYVGWSEVPVCTDAGPAGFVPDYLAGSDLLRCRQTAEFLFPAIPYEPLPEFREADFGAWEMKTYDDLKADVRYRSWINDPAVEHPPGGERFACLEDRVLLGIDQLRKQKVRSAAIVTHGGPARILLSHLAPEPRPFFGWSVPPGGLYRLEWSSRRSWEEGNRCTFISEVPITGSAST